MGSSFSYSDNDSLSFLSYRLIRSIFFYAWELLKGLSTPTSNQSLSLNMFRASSNLRLSADCCRDEHTSISISMVFFWWNALETVVTAARQIGQSKFFESFLIQSVRQPPQVVCKHGAIQTGSCINQQQMPHSCSLASLKIKALLADSPVVFLERLLLLGEIRCLL